MLSPYPLTESDIYSYEFITDNNFTYKVYFIDYSYWFEAYTQITSPIFAFNIEPLDNSVPLLADERIRLTVMEVIRQFFASINNVAIYVCDSLDSRQLARKRKFDRWFSGYEDELIIKENGIAIVDGVLIYNALLIHKNNTEFNAIIAAFYELNDAANN